jgi:hypothetical protein
MCFVSALETKFRTSLLTDIWGLENFMLQLQDEFPHGSHHKEVAISISNYTLKHGDTGLIIVGGSMEVQPQVFG